MAEVKRRCAAGASGGITPLIMAIETVALIKLPPSVFQAMPPSGEASSDPSRLRLKAESGASFEVRLLVDAGLVYTPVPFGADADALLETLWDFLGDALADHDDDRGVFVLPSVAPAKSATYDEVIDEVDEVGEWVALDDEEGDEDDEMAAEGDVMQGMPSMPGMPPGMPQGDDFMAMMASITNSLGPDTLMSLQQAMMSGDARAFERAQEAVAAKLSQRADIVDQLQGLMGAMPPGLRDMAMNTSPDELMKQMQGAVPPDQMAAMRKLSDTKGRKR